MASVFRVILPGTNPRTGAVMFVNFECRYPTLDLLVSDLNDGTIVMGSSLFTRKSREEKGVLEVVDRTPYAIGRAGVARIETPVFRFVEYEE